jgi:TetR/AcrR family transcriptional regulator, transcriptional repressor for nem operon
MLENDCKQVCLILKLTNEVASWSQPMRSALNAYFVELVAIYESVIEEGQAASHITKRQSAAHLASIVHDVWLGAYTRSIALQNVGPMRDGIACVRAYLTP